MSEEELAYKRRWIGYLTQEAYRHGADAKAGPPHFTVLDGIVEQVNRMWWEKLHPTFHVRPFNQQWRVPETKFFTEGEEP